MSRCPRCKCEATGQNRLVTDSCGHNKCRLCLLADVADCLECKDVRNINEAIAPEQPVGEGNTTDKHITSTALGYHCTVCNKSFRSRTQQYYHRACGNELLKKFNCTQCPRRFATRSHLKYHQDSHSNHASYICNICGKSFKQLTVQQRHMRVHNPLTFNCPKCPRLFRSQSALTAHALVHGDDSLTHKCEVCSKHYLTKANLKQHQLKHNQNNVQHNCHMCNKSFPRQSTLRLHQQRHSKRPRHACSQCHKNFNDRDALTRHLKQHIARQRYRCIQCEVTVNRRDNMLRHLRSMHPGVQFETGVELLQAEPSSSQAAPSAVETSSQQQRYNSVIKSVGNVEPIPQPDVEVEKPTSTTVAPLPNTMQNENVKLYRKIILDLDNEEYSNELSTGLDMDEPLTTVHEQEETHHEQPTRQGSANFSAMHWRKRAYQLNSIS